MDVIRNDWEKHSCQYSIIFLDSLNALFDLVLKKSWEDMA
jgi:hypothetical protein